MLLKGGQSAKRKAESEVDGERRTKGAPGQKDAVETDVGSVENRVRAELSLPPIISLSTASSTVPPSLPSDPVASTSTDSRNDITLPVLPLPAPTLPLPTSASAAFDPHVDEQGRTLPEGWTRNLSRSSSVGQCYYWDQERVVTSWTSPCDSTSGGSDEVSMVNHLAASGSDGKDADSSGSRSGVDAGVAGDGVLGSTVPMPRTVEVSQQSGGNRNGIDKHSPANVDVPATATASTTTAPYITNQAAATLSTAAAPRRRDRSLPDNSRNPPLSRSAHSSRSNSPHQSDYPTGPRLDRQRLPSGSRRAPTGNPNPQRLVRTSLNGDTISVSIKDTAVPIQPRSRASSSTSTTSSTVFDGSRTSNSLASTSASTSTSNPLLDRIELPPAMPINPNYKGKHHWTAPPIPSAIPSGPRHLAGQPSIPRAKVGPPTGPKHAKTPVVAKSNSDPSLPLVDRFAGSAPVAEAGGLLYRLSQPVKKPYSKPSSTSFESEVGAPSPVTNAAGAEVSRVTEGASRGVGGIRG